MLVAPGFRTSFIGRTDEVRQALTLLRRARLLTLTGPGGVGKTRLALTVAEAAASEFRDGVAVVSLAAISDPAHVPTAIATAFDMRQGDRPPLDAIRDLLAPRETLLVLDNFEQVSDAALVVAELLGACPRVRVLVTSRTPLGLAGEQLFLVPPLDVPVRGHATLAAALGHDAVGLFVARARTVRPDFQLTPENLEPVVDLCRQLDGLPLAIELAAARVRHLSPDAIRGRLDRQLALLTGGPRDSPPRQQTMHATIAWTYDLLTAEQQRLLRRLSVFTDGWTLELAEAVWDNAGDLVENLSRLIDHSLLRRIEDADSGDRFDMLETIRAFARERLHEQHEDVEARRRHAECLRDLVLAIEPALRGPHERAALNRLEREHENLRAVLTWALGHDPSLGLEVAGAIWRFWMAHGHLTEGVAWVTQLAAVDTSAALAIRGKALVGAGALALELDKSDRASALATEGLRLAERAGDQRVVAEAHYRLGMLARDAGDVDAVTGHFELALTHYRTLDDTIGIAGTLNNWGIAAQMQHDLERAELLLTESLTLARQFGDTRGIRSALANLATVAFDRGEYARATLLFEEARALAQQAEDPLHLAHLARYLAMIQLAQGNLIASYGYVVGGLRAYCDLDVPSGIEASLVLLTEIALAAGQPLPAAHYLGAADTLRDRYGLVAHHEHLRDQLRTQLGADNWTATYERGKAWSVEEVLAEALQFTVSPTTPPGTRQPTALSKREAEVLRLIVEGKTNQEIAAALFISPNTVTNHVVHILNKLGLESRTAAAAYAVRHGLA